MEKDLLHLSPQTTVAWDPLVSHPLALPGEVPVHLSDENNTKYFSAFLLEDFTKSPSFTSSDLSASYLIFSKKMAANVIA